ncbi:MAG: hypothetical protein OEY23_14350 [Acidimicrobiia bacterium]|nr:hypothetical protein [Acidimicrobiia bacterium]
MTYGLTATVPTSPIAQRVWGELDVAARLQRLLDERDDDTRRTERVPA